MSKKCERCGMEYEISKKTQWNRDKHNIPDLCKDCMKKRTSEKSLDYWNNLTPEQHAEHNRKVSESINNISNEKKEELFQKRKENHTNFWKNMTDEQRKEMGNKIKNSWTDEMRLKQSEWRKNIIKNMSKEQKESWIKKITQQTQNYWDNADEDTKIKKRDQLHKGLKNYFDSSSEEELNERNNKISNRMKEYWDKHPEMKEIFSELQHELYLDEVNRERSAIIMKAYWDSLSNEQLSEISKREKERYDNLSQEEKDRRRQLAINWWKNLSKEEKEIRRQRSIDYWDNLSEEEMQKHRQRSLDWWNNLTNEELDKWNKDRVHAIMRNGTKLEDELLDYLRLYNIKYERQYSNKTKHKDFDKLFSINPITGSDIISYKHRWDYLLHSVDNYDVLIDIDGSLHNIGENEIIMDDINIGLYTKWLDYKREYCTDDLDAYIIIAYDNTISLKSMVFNIKTKTECTLEEFLNMLSYKEN